MSDQEPFVDCMNVSGRRIQQPGWAGYLALKSQLETGDLVPFSLERQGDRDACLDVNLVDGAFVITGMEDSRERGTFAFCYVDPEKTSELILAGGEYYPEYSATNEVNKVIEIARTYFRSGELDRSVTWHVSRTGVGKRLEDIPQSEMLMANDQAMALDRLLRGAKNTYR